MRSFLLVLSLICLCSQTAISWKKEEFCSCDQTPFCKRPRSRTPGACSLIFQDVSITDGDLMAKLLPKTPNGDQIKPMVLSISVYTDGIVRLRVDEDHSLNPPKKRFRVPDVVVSELEGKKIWLQKVATETISGDTIPSSIVYVSDGYEAVVRHDPFEVFVREKSGDRRRVVSLNSHGLFYFEQLVKKTEEDNWEEKFMTIQIRDRLFINQLASMFLFMIPVSSTEFLNTPLASP